VILYIKSAIFYEHIVFKDLVVLKKKVELSSK